MQSMTPSARKRHQMERELLEQQASEMARQAHLKRVAAKHTMALWNIVVAAGWRAVFYPSVGTACSTGCHWLHVKCPACQQIGEVDLRTIDIHPGASLATVIRTMSCRRCTPHAPFAIPLGATRRSWYTSQGWVAAKRR